MRREESSWNMAVVDQESMRVVMDEGKSEPVDMTQETVLERGGGEKRRAPRAEYVPAPPGTSKTGGVGGRK